MFFVLLLFLPALEVQQSIGVFLQVSLIRLGLNKRYHCTLIYYNNEMNNEICF
jgi:hypothetical protein